MKLLAITARKIFFCFVLIILVASFVYFLDRRSDFIPVTSAGTEHNLSGFAWSENIGWMSFNNTTGGGGTDYGVNLDAAGNFSGFAWSEHIGWVKFNPTGPYPALPNYSAKLDLTTNQITGWARVCAGTINGDCVSATRTDGWDGWIKMSGTNYGVTRTPGSPNCNLTGYAWGSEVVGWISFKNTTGVGAAYGVTSTFCEEEKQKCKETGVSDWGACQCSTEKKTRTHYRERRPDGDLDVPICANWDETQDCDYKEKNSCRNFNWREVAP